MVEFWVDNEEENIGQTLCLTFGPPALQHTGSEILLLNESTHGILDID
jgi:hypothetical protein